MSKFRTRGERGPLDKVGILPNGRPMCRFCKGPCPPPKRTFCSEECIHQWKIRSDAQYARQFIFNRDKGVCAACGKDTQALRASLRKLHEEELTDWEARVDLLKQQHQGWPSNSFWEADHIVPVWKGGGECGLEGFQTLCYWCHKVKSKAEATERAELKRKGRQPK